jgi:signal transduction histidine kinase
MRVRVELTVEVDPEVWATEYGVTGAAAIREDVRSKVRHDLRTHLVDDLGVASEVYVAASSYRPASIPGLR